MTTLLADDLIELRRLKDVAEEAGTVKKDSDAAFKQHMAKALERMEIERSASFRDDNPDGYLYSVNKRVKGQIEDRKQYVRWALENDEGILAFLDWLWRLTETHDLPEGELETRFYDAIMGTSMVKYHEDGTAINGQARSHVDDEAPLPPGLTFRPDPYIGMTKS